MSLTSDERITIYDLLDAELSIAEISRRIDRSTGAIQKVKRTRQNIDPNTTSVEISQKILPVKDYIDDQVKNSRINVTVLYKNIKQNGYLGSYGTLNNYIRTHLPSTKLKSYKPSQRRETGPGEEAQMDWGSFGRITINSEKKRLYAFLYVLSYSRMLYVEFTLSQKMATLQSCHKHAFERLGIPKYILYDNMKQVVTRIVRLPDGTRKPRFNPEFINFANHFRYELKACGPYWPRSKGKVESAVKFLRYNFMRNQSFGKTFHSLEELNERASKWVEEINQRLHRTTEQRPIELWVKEEGLLSFPKDIPAFHSEPFLTRRANKDNLVQHKMNFYTVPNEYGQKKLFVREVDRSGIKKLEIYQRDKLIYTYDLSYGRGEIMVIESTKNPTVYRRTTRNHKPRVPKRNKYKVLVPQREISYYENLVKKT